MIPHFDASDGKHRQLDVVHLSSTRLLQDTIRLASQDFTNILFLLSTVFHVFRPNTSQPTTLIDFHVYLSFAFLLKSCLIMRASVRDLCLSAESELQAAGAWSCVQMVRRAHLEDYTVCLFFLIC